MRRRGVAGVSWCVLTVLHALVLCCECVIALVVCQCVRGVCVAGFTRVCHCVLMVLGVPVWCSRSVPVCVAGVAGLWCIAGAECPCLVLQKCHYVLLALHVLA